MTAVGATSCAPTSNACSKSNQPNSADSVLPALTATPARVVAKGRQHGRDLVSPTVEFLSTSNELGRELSDRGIEQFVLTSEAQTWDFADWPTRVVKLPWNRGPRDANAVAKELRDIVRLEKIDLVHAHATFAGVASRLKRLDVPVIYQPHGWGHLSTRRKSVKRAVQAIERRLDRRTHTLLTLSEHEAAEAPNARQAERVRPIVDLTGFEPMVEKERLETRLELGWGKAERIHICVGETQPS